MSRRNRPWPEPPILRIDRMEKWADAYRIRAMQRGDMHRAMRAANFMTTLYNRTIGVVLAEVSTYTDFDGVAAAR